MPFSLSGDVAVGANEGLQQVLDRRLKEQIRLQQEKEHADRIAVTREQMAATERDRLRDEAYRRGQVERQDATTARGDAMVAAERITPGSNISADTAGLLMKHPGLKPQVVDRKLIDARPVDNVPLPGGTTMSLPGLKADQSQAFNFQPSYEQAKALQRVLLLKRAGADLANANNETARRQVYARDVVGNDLAKDVPIGLAGPTEKEKQETAKQNTLDAEEREMKRWYEMNRITSGQQDRRAELGRTGKPPTGLQTKAVEFYNRVKESNAIMDKYEDKLTSADVATISGLGGILPENVSNIINSVALSPAGKQYVLALATFTDPRLREVSGAAVMTGEYESDRRMFSKQMNETPELAAQRKRIRKLVEEGLAVKSGPAYEAYWGEPFVPTIKPGEIPDASVDEGDAQLREIERRRAIAAAAAAAAAQPKQKP
jgi:hypothetical protein